MSRITLIALCGTLAMAACVDPAMEQRIAELETKVTTLEEQAKKAPAARAANAPPQVDQKREQEAATKYNEIRNAIKEMKIDEAKAQIAALEKDYSDTRAGRAIRKTKAELEVYGKDAIDLKVEKWYTKQTDMKSGKATMLVFWEVWCPHCKREVPKLQAMYDKYNSQGFNMVGLTRITKSATEESVAAFVKDNNISYPVAKQDGEEMSRHYGIGGIPAAAVVRDGKVIWRGHPAQITEDMIEQHFIN